MFVGGVRCGKNQNGADRDGQKRIGERWNFTVVNPEPQIPSRSLPGTHISWVYVLLICNDM